MVEGCPISICSYSFPQDTFCLWNLVLASAMWQTQTEESACFCEHYFLGDVSSSFAHEASPHPYIKMPTSAEQTLILPSLLKPSQWEAPLSSQFCQHRLVAHPSGVLQRQLQSGALGRDVVVYVTFRSLKHIQNPDIVHQSCHWV